MYWMFHWPAEFAAFVNSRAGTKLMRKRGAAPMIFLGFTLIEFDGGISLAVLFAALDLIEHRLDAFFMDFSRVVSILELMRGGRPYASRRRPVLVRELGTLFIQVQSNARNGRLLAG